MEKILDLIKKYRYLILGGVVILIVVVGGVILAKGNKRRNIWH